MDQFAGISLKIRLYLVVLAAFVPVAVLILHVTEEQKAAETEAIFQETRILARASASQENQQLEAAHALLRSVADAFLAFETRSDQLNGFLTNILKQSDGYKNVGVLATDGRLLAGVNVSNDGSNGFAGRSWFSDCLRSGRLSLGRYHGEHIGADPVIYIGLPVLDRQRQTQAVAFAALNLTRLNQTVFSCLAELPKGSRLTLLEQGGAILRYDNRAGRLTIPSALEPDLTRSIIEQKSGVFSRADETGRVRIYAFAPLTGGLRTGAAYLVLEVPREAALSASMRNFKRNIGLLIGCALVAVLAVWRASEVLILRRVRSMVAAGRKLSAGDLTTRIGDIGGSDELSHLAAVFDEMAASLQLRLEEEHRVLESLERSREQLRKLAAYQNDVREQERIRIARELHDRLGQSLTILKMDLSWLKKKLPPEMTPVREKTDTMSNVIDDALHDLHSVTAELRPVILDDFGLAAAIEWQVEEFRSHSGIDCRLKHDGFEPDLPKEKATALFRIFQETLTNILRHARADRVRVGLESRVGELVLEVEDNGRGITQAEINDPGAFGLLGMRERLRPWNGQVSFEGQPGLGTRVVVRLPMQPDT